MNDKNFEKIKQYANKHIAMYRKAGLLWPSRLLWPPVIDSKEN